ncbi:hypothetical protein LAZ67_18001570 [Cordylochernes scorpioides]|uniref:Transposase n=1 Tax=Cordylochernes scorpioides TaxID=51811 RepID=A0ABY6LGS5_9ARAC|nr:hypothetical protein LAZ67_18001570 [Cordylochernes scorpioides]
MPGHRKRRQFKQTDAFTRGMVIGLKRAGWSIRQIAADTHLGASTVHRLWRRWLEQGNVAIYRNVGATRVTSARVDRRILRQAVAAPQATCTAILQHVQDTLDHSISTRTISRRLVANVLHSCRPLRRLPLTPPNRRQRLEWCRARSTWMTEWHRVVFSSESRFCLSSDSRRVRVWRRRGERSNPAAIVERPTVRQRGIMGTMTAQRYVDHVLRPVTLPYLQGVPNALYQQDNARPHTARISQQVLQDVQMLPWPPYSPDLSPIEHVWDIIGRRLHALPQPRSEDELWQMVEREWRAIPQDAIHTLIDSLPRRVAACIAVRGVCLLRLCLETVQVELVHAVSGMAEVILADGVQADRAIFCFRHQRAVIKFNAKLGKSASETYILKKQVYGTLCLSKSNVFIWHKRFSDGRNTLEDDKHTRRPSSSKDSESIEKVREFVANNRSASLRIMAQVLHINKETIRNAQKVCAKFVPHTLTGEQKSLRIAHCRDIISAYENDSNFLKAWCFQYDPKTKRQSAEWKSKNSPQAKKARKVPSKIKTMLITFFDSRGIIHKEFVPAGHTLTGEYYLNVLKRLIARIRRIRPEYRDADSWCLLHDNAPSHFSLIVRRFLAKNNPAIPEKRVSYKQISDFTRGRIVGLREGGILTGEIAMKVGCNQSTVVRSQWSEEVFKKTWLRSSYSNNREKIGGFEIWLKQTGQLGTTVPRIQTVLHVQNGPSLNTINNCLQIVSNFDYR